MIKAPKSLYFLATLIFLIFSFPIIYAFPVSPPTEIIDFKPNLHYSFEYKVGNRQSTPLDIVMYPDGDLKNFIRLSDNKATIMPGEWKTFTADVNLPDNIEKPGVHKNSIIVEEVIPPATGIIGGRVAIELQVLIRVPYPGKYIEARLEIPDGEVGEPLKIKIFVANRGKEDINDIRASIDIHDINGVRIATVNTNSISLHVGEENYIYAEWVPSVSAGRYLAKAHITYDENFEELEKEFRIGELLIAINNIFIKEGGIMKNSIAKFVVEVESKWNEPIEDAYIILEAGNSTKTMGTKSETFDIGAWQINQISLYWDATGYTPGAYTGKVIVYYELKTTSSSFEFNIVETSFFKKILTINTLVVVLVALVVLLILINISQFIKKHKAEKIKRVRRGLKKKAKKESEKSKTPEATKEKK